MHTAAVPEFGPNHEGQTVIIVRAMYGLKSSGAASQAQLSSTLYSMDFEPTMTDPDVWTRAASRPDGFEYYEHILVDVDDLLDVSHDPSVIMITSMNSQYYTNEAIHFLEVEFSKSGLRAILYRRIFECQYLPMQILPSFFHGCSVM